jgi:transcriptional regulator with XRE-family HTH domain
VGFAENLKYLMEANNLSNYSVAKKLGVSQTSVANWLSGGNTPHRKTMLAIASLFGLTVDELNGDDRPCGSLENKKSPAPFGAELDLDRIHSMLSGMSTDDLAAILSLAANEMAKRSGK